jgi:type VII secretion integral membrane protein EccD
LGLVLLCAQSVPGVAARAAALQRPFVPTRPADLREQPPAPPADTVLQGVARADRYVVALSGAVAAISVVSAALTLGESGWGPPALAALAAMVLALRARFFSSAGARWLLLGGAVVMLGPLLFALAARLGGAGDLYLVLTMLGGAGLGTWLAHRLPGGRLSPWWGRIGDISEVVATVAAIPVCLQVAGVYDLVRALGG